MNEYVQYSHTLIFSADPLLSFSAPKLMIIVSTFNVAMIPCRLNIKQAFLHAEETKTHDTERC